MHARLTRCLATGVFVTAAIAGPALPVRAADDRAVRFEAVVGDRPFACGQSYDRIGVSASSMTVADFRFYVSNVRLIGVDGSEQPVGASRRPRCETSL